MGVNGKYPIRHVDPGRAIVSGSFVTANDADPSVKNGKGFTVTRAAEGRWTVTLRQASSEIESVLVSVAPETLTHELYCCYVDQDSIDTDSFEIRLLTNADTSAGASALDDDPGALISFLAVVRDTSLA